jgi:hypothetical protein
VNLDKIAKAISTDLHEKDEGAVGCLEFVYPAA